MKKRILKLTAFAIVIALMMLNAQPFTEKNNFDLSLSSLVKTVSASGEGSGKKYIKVTSDSYPPSSEVVTVLCPDGRMKMAQMTSVLRTTTCHVGGSQDCTPGSTWVRVVTSPC